MGTNAGFCCFSPRRFHWLAANANGQDAPSLGDLARQQRQEKGAPGKEAKAPKVITNEEISERAEAASLHRTGAQENAVQASSNGPRYRPSNGDRRL